MEVEKLRMASNLYGLWRGVSEIDAKAHRWPRVDPSAFQAVASEVPSVASSVDYAACLPSTPEARVRAVDDGPPIARRSPVAPRSVHSMLLHENRQQGVCTLLQTWPPSSKLALKKDLQSLFCDKRLKRWLWGAPKEARQACFTVGLDDRQTTYEQSDDTFYDLNSRSAAPVSLSQGLVEVDL